MKKTKSNLDERQELTLLQIEHNGCWLAFWGLLLVLSVQLILGNSSIGALAGEWAVFMCLALYLMIACIRNGIWDRKWKPNFKTNLLFSSIGALSAGIIWAAVSYRNYHRLAGSLAAGLFMFLTTEILCLLALTLSAKLYQKRLHQLEDDV